MNYRAVPFTEVGAKVWDEWLSGMQSATYLHSSWMLEYLHQTVPSEHGKSFALLDDTGNPLALCPLGISFAKFGINDFREGSWNGAPLAYPAIRECDPTRRRRLLRNVFDVLHDIADNQKIIRLTFRVHPLSLGIMHGHTRPINIMEALSQGYFCEPQNTVVIDLGLSEHDLEARMTQYHRKHIHKSERQGLTIKVLQGDDPSIGVVFSGYQEAHFLSSGRLTRPQKTFDLMRDYLFDKHAALFVAYIRDMPISYLYCGQFDRIAFGWSQVNVGQFEREYSPRHLLEWEAIKWYKGLGFLYYEIGTRWYGPQMYKVPTPKEVTIAEFKERYGGDLWPDFCFERFFDKKIYEEVMQERQATFLSSDYFHADVERST